jgi:N-acetylneuraminate synthase
MKADISQVFEKNNKKPFIIAEMSGNHNQSLERALEIVDKAAEAGT